MSPRRRSFSKSLATILGNPGDGLKPLFARASRLQALDQALRGALGEPLGPHIHVSNVRDDTAIVSADSPAWLTQLRFLAPTILHILQQQPGCESLRKVQFRVRPASVAAEVRRPPRRAQRSAAGAETLQSAAEHVGDAELGEALRRLARHVGRKD